jgi:hypothetical protein
MIFTTRPNVLVVGLLWSALLLAFAPAANARQIFGAPKYIGLSNGLVGWWTFDGNDTTLNGSGLISAIDRSGNNKHASAATVAANPSIKLGRIGQGYEFSRREHHGDKRQWQRRSRKPGSGYVGALRKTDDIT